MGVLAVMAEEFSELPGLPTTGPMPVPFSATGQGTHREGYVVEFRPGTENAWVGNFQRGLSGYDKVVKHPNGKHLVVISGGQAYVIDPDSKQEINNFGGDIQYCAVSPELPGLVFGNGLWIIIIYRNGRMRQTERISWDGMRGMEIRGRHLEGEAYDPTTDRWCAFQVDLQKARHEGGSYIPQDIG
jgi:hypothetical protein